MLAQKALARSGFGDVHLLDRRLSKQKTRDGGHELACYCTFGILRVKVVVKLINDPVNLRMCSELASTVRRMKADFGVIIGTRHVTAAAKKHLAFFRDEKVVILNGDSFASLLRKHRLGVRPGGAVDYAYLSALEHVSPKIICAIRRTKDE